MDEKNNSSDAVASPLVAGHTPGPWVVDGSERGVIKTAPAEDRSWRFIAEVIVNAALITDEERANARLIAAAPALYDAARHLLASGIINPTGSKHYAARIAALSAAITAAEGK